MAMKALPDEVVYFFESQGCVIVSSVDAQGFPHSSCKGIVSIDRRGKVYLLDAYRAETFTNLKRDPHVSMTAFDEHKFVGYCLKGIAAIVPEEALRAEIVKAWDDKIISRLSQAARA